MATEISHRHNHEMRTHQKELVSNISISPYCTICFSAVLRLLSVVKGHVSHNHSLLPSNRGLTNRGLDYSSQSVESDLNRSMEVHMQLLDISSIRVVSNNQYVYPNCQRRHPGIVG